MPDGQSLFGLTPEQIGGISGRRIQRETQAFQTAKDLADLQAQRRAAELIDVQAGGKTYKVPRGGIAAGLKAYQEFETAAATRAKTAQETEELRLRNQPIEVSFGGKRYNVPQGMMKDIADATATFQQVGAREELRGVTPETLGQAPGFGAALVGAPGAAIAEIQRKAQAAGPGGLEERDRRQLADLQDKMITGVTTAPAQVTPGNLQIINQNAKVLGQNTMYYPAEKVGFFGKPTGEFEPRQVQLPVTPQGIQRTPQDVEDFARAQGITVFEAIKIIEDESIKRQQQGGVR